MHDVKLAVGLQWMIQNVAAHLGAVDKHRDVKAQPVLIIQHITADCRITGENFLQGGGDRGPRHVNRTIRRDTS